MLRLSGDTVRVMPLRTCRRRISPRTKRRYRAIKEFFKRTIGTLSNTDYVTNSSIAVSVSDLKSKIDIIEQQLEKVSKHCRNLTCVENGFNNADGSIDHKNQKRPEAETEILYETPRRNFVKSDDSENSKLKLNGNTQIMNDVQSSSYSERQLNVYKQHDRKSKQAYNESCLKTNNLKENKYDCLKRVTSSITFQACKDTHTRSHRYDVSNKSHNHDDKVKDKNRGCSEKIKRELSHRRDIEHRKSRKKKRRYSAFDEEFIEDIIRRQYKPVKLFGRKISEFSQFSAPVCRDQEYTIRNDIEEGSELCSCCFEGHRNVSHRHCRKYDLNDMRSVCDARLYGAKRHRWCKEGHTNNYNDSTLYDLIPVKEKSSPKTRRKFIEENVQYERCREVLPSPRTHKPRLNLKAQSYDYDDSLLPKRRKNVTPLKRTNNGDEMSEDFSQTSRHRRTSNEPLTLRTHVGNGNPSQNANLVNESFTGSAADKTDKALCEIKDILQSFLQEIKKDSVHSDHSEVSGKSIKHTEAQVNNKPRSSPTPNIEQCHASFVPPFGNSCCYPILPVCPINCSPYGPIPPSTSYTCASCVQNKKEIIPHVNDDTKNNSCHDETQELIKEIYKCVTRSPTTPRSKRLEHSYPRYDFQKKVLTSRSVGSSNASKHDVMVETPKMKCYSKSCEAIGSRVTTDTYSTNPTYSDTAIEKLSLDTSHSSTDTEVKKNKFSNVLKKMGLFKKKRKDVIEEVSESEGTEEVDVKPKSKPPFKQNIMNYNLHAQEYFHPPPNTRCNNCYDHGFCSPHVHTFGDDGYSAQKASYERCKHRTHPHCYSTPQYCEIPNVSSAYCHHDRDPQCHNGPQVPLCLKEIEVKSIGTQSERKLSIFPRFKKYQAPQARLNPQNTMTTQTPKEKNILFNWEKLKEKATQNASNADPMKFSLKTQKQLALGDMTMRNAMLKKLFYKRNPFSPRNLIVRTLLGKDRSSWGEPPRMYKPRMFI
ncbi:unnamed protein product [Leptosia nina]|uniref:Uncharacterized protein n=1 Tax=Leptosia nina TaxID=320188 RepID=A0AAV1JVC1_9NEOP